jgi:hypothetical protein
MEPSILQPLINPLKFHRMEPPQIERYVSKHYLDYPFFDTLDEWEDPYRPFFQPWMQADTIKLQFQGNINPIQVYFLRCDGIVLLSETFTQKQQYSLDTSWHIYEYTKALSSFPEGRYFVKLVAGTLTFISEPLDIRAIQENTLLLEYNHFRFYADVIMETGITFSLRIPGALKTFTPASKDTTYEDQSLNLTMLKAVPYRVWQLLIGGVPGIPDYLIDKLNIILGCSNLQIDGRFYTKGSSQLEAKALENYRMRGWSIDMREKLNRMSVMDTGEATMTGVVMIAAASDTKGFGVTDSGDSVLTDAI